MPVKHFGSIEEEARHLVKMNQSEVRTIERSYVFHDPAEKTIRVVHEDRLAFPADTTTLIATVDSEGATKLPLPEGWGVWAEAEVIERPHRRKAVA